MAATKMFLIKWYSSSTNLESSGSRLGVVWTSWKSSDKAVWTSRKSSGLPGSRLDFQEVVWIFLSVLVFQIWKTSGTTYLLVVWKSSGSRLEVATYNSVVHETTEIRLTIKSSGGRLNYKSSARLKCKSSGEVKLLKLSIDDLTFSRLRLQISKSIAKITSALTRRLPGKSSTARRLPNSLAYIRLLQAHRITNESHPPIIVSFYDSMNHKNFRIKILGFFSSLWRESERYVVFSSQEWKKKKGKSILGALRASNWLFMVVVVLMTMAIL
ncbi:hypothetical protein IGI04_002001 [Brassica rapa subsp. trilocularis]|uniref:Uncharacterized protein n=1 Tax=Brassica rapa subsp. trilocularis TaxID=1813537 RepID=A0ABQ7NXK1_BRACM|nr:hypothetical protein IGI04_002001 [Brassica rapa subsp. trilocularis]